MAAASLAFDLQGPRHGLPVVLLHGFPFDRSIWADTAAALARAGFRSVTLDLPGHGKSPALTATSMKSMADAVTQTLLQAQIRAAVWVGHSMGGYVAIEKYAAAPQDVLGLALVCTRAAADDDTGRAARDDMIDRIGREGMEPVAETMIRRIVSARTHIRDPDLVRRLQNLMGHASTDGAVRAVLAMKERLDHSKTLESVEAPTLVVAGSDDEIVPADEMHRMGAAIRGSRVRTIEGAAHMPMVEEPEAFLEVLMDWVTENDRSGRWQALSTSRK